MLSQQCSEHRGPSPSILNTSLEIEDRGIEGTDVCLLVMVGGSGEVLSGIIKPLETIHIHGILIDL